jgi:hypothetical protein
MRRIIALLLSATLAAPGCATMRPAAQVNDQSQVLAAGDRALMADYVGRLSIGSRIKATSVTGGTVHGTLMKVTDTAIVIQPRTRIPEAPVQVPLDNLRAVELEGTSGGNVGKAIAIGVAVGAGTFLGLMLLAFAAFDD